MNENYIWFCVEWEKYGKTLSSQWQEGVEEEQTGICNLKLSRLKEFKKTISMASTSGG
jgi:hypothetical protein